MLTLQRLARAVATSAGGAASRQRPLSAAAAAAAMPSNVTASVPRSGPLQLPPGAPVWKRKPGAPTQVLYERTPKEMLKNLQYLAASPHGASRPAPLHRLLERVQTRADLDLAIRGLNTLSNSKTELNRGTTARLLAEAAIRAGAPEVAVETFTKWKSSGLRPGKQALAALFTAVQAPAQRELLSSTINCMWAAGPAFDGTPIDPVSAPVRVAWARQTACAAARVRGRPHARQHACAAARFGCYTRCRRACPVAASARARTRARAVHRLLRALPSVLSPRTHHAPPSLGAAPSRRSQFMQSLASCIVTAYTRVGDLENAVRMYIRVRCGVGEPARSTSAACVHRGVPACERSGHVPFAPACGGVVRQFSRARASCRPP